MVSLNNLRDVRECFYVSASVTLHDVSSGVWIGARVGYAMNALASKTGEGMLLPEALGSRICT